MSWLGGAVFGWLVDLLLEDSLLEDDVQLQE